MTENESIKQAIRCVVGACDETCPHYWSDGVCHGYEEVAKGLEKALEEIQQYRAIGLTPELIEAMQGHNVALINDLGEYQAIGTVEEFKALKVENEELHCEIQAINATMDLLEKEIRAKAIDEFAEKLSLEVSESIIWDMLATMSKNSSLSDTSDKIVDYVINTANEIAKQLKAGGENE